MDIEESSHPFILERWFTPTLNVFQEAMNMVTPSMQLASKIPDVHIQLWASALLKGTILLFILFLINLFELIPHWHWPWLDTWSQEHCLRRDRWLTQVGVQPGYAIPSEPSLPNIWPPPIQWWFWSGHKPEPLYTSHPVSTLNPTILQALQDLINLCIWTLPTCTSVDSVEAYIY
jgi:hypothetical protein